MAENVDAQVHFYNRYSGAIKFSTNSNNEEKIEFGQILAFNCLAARQMLNLDPYTAFYTAKILVECSAFKSEIEPYQTFVSKLETFEDLDTYIPLIAALGVNIEELLPHMNSFDIKTALASGINASEIVKEFFPNSATLVDYKGEGEKQFRMSIKWGSRKISYKIDPKGFGFLGKDVGWYASNSVFLFFRYLSEINSNQYYKEALTNSAHKCGLDFLVKRLKRSNQRVFPLETTYSVYYYKSQWF